MTELKTTPSVSEYLIMKRRLEHAEKLIEESNLPSSEHMHLHQGVAYDLWNRAKEQ